MGHIFSRPLQSSTSHRLFGLLMLLLHVNVIGDKISSQTTIKLFAGGALLCRTIHDPYDEIQLQQGLNKLTEWSKMAYALQCQ